MIIASWWEIAQFLSESAWLLLWGAFLLSIGTGMRLASRPWNRVHVPAPVEKTPVLAALRRSDPAPSRG